MSEKHWHRKVIFGKTGSGKTVLSRNLVKDRRRVLYIDSKGYDFKEGVICDGIDQLRQYWGSLAERDFNGDFRIVFRSDYPVKDFPAVCDLVMACGDMTIVVDEMDMYFKKGETSPEFNNVIRRGRGQSVEVIGITQRPRQMAEIRSMAQEAFIFNTHEKSDLNYMASLHLELLDHINKLQPYDYVWVDIDQGLIEIRKEAAPYEDSQAIEAEIKTTTETVPEDSSTVDRSEQPGEPVGLLQPDSGSDSQDQPV